MYSFLGRKHVNKDITMVVFMVCVFASIAHFSPLTLIFMVWKVEQLMLVNLEGLPVKSFDLLPPLQRYFSAKYVRCKQVRIQDFLKGGGRGEDIHKHPPPPWTLSAWRHPPSGTLKNTPTLGHSQAPAPLGH